MSDFITSDYFRQLEKQSDWQSDEGLKSSIKEYGCVQPVLVWTETNTLVDGHRRVLICSELDMPYAVIQKSFKDQDDAARFVQEQQAFRRNLTPEQVQERYQKLIKERTTQSGSEHVHPSIGDIADESGVSKRKAQFDSKKAKVVSKLPESVQCLAEEKLNRQAIADVARLQEQGAEPEQIEAIISKAVADRITITDAKEKVAPDVKIKDEDRLALLYENPVKLIDATIRSLKAIQECEELKLFYTNGVHTRVLQDLKAARGTLNQNTPEAHKRCHGLGCAQCEERGWVTKGENRA